MKVWALIVISISLGSAQAAPRVLLSGFDPFKGARSNNSWTLVQSVAQDLRGRGIEVHTCLLPTSYERGIVQLEKCLSELPGKPDVVLSLGETGCHLKLETRMFNLDHNPARNSAPDNDGVHRVQRAIIPGAPWTLGMRLDLPSIYCALSSAEKSVVKVDAFAGHFVCNNVAYQFSYRHPELIYSFAHVPTHDCKEVTRRNPHVRSALVRLVETQLNLNQQTPGAAPHVSNILRLAADRSELDAYWGAQDETRECAVEFARRWRQAIR
jgi:pyroglutamyl-peptidase